MYKLLRTIITITIIIDSDTIVKYAQLFNKTSYKLQ